MLLQILQHTPLWVFGLFLVLIFLGYTQSKTRQISAQRLTIMPAIMLALSALGIWSTLGATVINFASWAIGITLACVLNLWFKQPRGAAYIENTNRYLVPGSWVPLCLMMLLFFTKYSVAVILVRTPALHHSFTFASMASLIFGFGSGLFFARALFIYSQSNIKFLASSLTIYTTK